MISSLTYEEKREERKRARDREDKQIIARFSHVPRETAKAMCDLYESLRGDKIILSKSGNPCLDETRKQGKVMDAMRSILGGLDGESVFMEGWQASPAGRNHEARYLMECLNAAYFRTQPKEEK